MNASQTIPCPFPILGSTVHSPAYQKIVQLLLLLQLITFFQRRMCEKRNLTEENFSLILRWLLLSWLVK